MTPYSAILTGLVLLLLSSGAQAQAVTSPDLGLMCRPDPLAELVTPDTGAPEDAPVRFTADTAQSSASEALLEGDVLVEQGDRRLQASSVSLDRLSNRLHAGGGVTYGDPTLAVRSREADVDMESEVGVFRDAEYFLPERNIQGSAERVEANRRTNQARLEGVTYSTCDRGAEFWQMRTRQLDVDQESGRGSARHITFAIRDVPILYFPYLSFPIDDERHSGFLAPRFGYESESGVDIRVPYYWNIAPDRDMTIAPRILSERGLLLGGEYRFLNPRDRGEIRLEYLPDDQVFGADRYSAYIAHQANPLPGFYTDLLYQHVSDDDYLDDLDNNLDLLSPTYLERRLDTVYYGGPWTALARLQDFQTIDEAIFGDDEPYNRLPQLVFSGAWPRRSNGLTYDLHSELVRFDRDTGVTGIRGDLQAGLSLPLQWPAGFLIPRLSYRYTAYDLQNTAPEASETPSRGAPIVSVDGGLFFERPVQGWGGQAGIWTLEPRLFYLYVPFRDQSDIPVFDSAEIDRSYSWLFLENRFIGADRLGDANQLTTALTTRLLNARDGRERLRASIGQVRYFRDRRVTLENTAPEEDSRSELIAEAWMRLTRALSLRSAVHWDPSQEMTRRSIVDLRYHPGDGRLLNIAYRFARDELEQVDISLLWPLGPQWRTMARWNYSLSQERNLDAFAGFEYGECCWALRMLARQHRDSPQDEEAKNSIYFELELRGLAGIGTSIDRMMERSILGYQRTRY